MLRIRSVFALVFCVDSHLYIYSRAAYVDLQSAMDNLESTAVKIVAYPEIKNQRTRSSHTFDQIASLIGR